MKARQQLAALHHNYNVGCQQAQTRSGEERWKKVFPKAKQWVVKKVYEKTSRVFIFDLIEDVLETKRQLVADRVPECVAEYPPIPDGVPANIATEPCPPKEDLIAQHVSRMG